MQAGWFVSKRLDVQASSPHRVVVGHGEGLWFFGGHGMERCGMWDVGCEVWGRGVWESGFCSRGSNLQWWGGWDTQWVTGVWGGGLTSCGVEECGGQQCGVKVCRVEECGVEKCGVEEYKGREVWGREVCGRGV